MDFKKLFLRTLIAALCASAGIGIMIFLFGNFGYVEINLGLTTLTIGGFSLTGLCCSTIFERKELKRFSAVGIIFSIAALTISLMMIWEISWLEDTWELLFILIILAVGSSHVSLLLLIQPKNNELARFRTITLIIITAVVALLILGVIELIDSDFYYRLLGALCILDVLGTILIPILNRISTDSP